MVLTRIELAGGCRLFVGLPLHAWVDCDKISYWTLVWVGPNWAIFVFLLYRFFPLWMTQPKL